MCRPGRIFFVSNRRPQKAELHQVVVEDHSVEGVRVQSRVVEYHAFRPCEPLLVRGSDDSSHGRCPTRLFLHEATEEVEHEVERECVVQEEFFS